MLTMARKTTVMRVIIVGLAVIIGLGTSLREKPYTGFKLVEITAENSETLEKILRDLPNIDDLSRNHRDNSIVAIVTRDGMDQVMDVVSSEKAVINILQDNLQNLVDEQYNHFDQQRRKRRSVSLEEYVKGFLTLDEIYDFQDRVVSTCNGQAIVVKKTIGYSANNKPITVLQISKDGLRSKRPTIFIEAGVHAREWLSPATANYIVHQLACKGDNNDLLDLFNWEVISVVNPDGFHYTHSGHRFWRKNRQINEDSSCVGTDINRNFESGYGMEDGASADTCENTYQGAYKYSTPEAMALRDYVLSISDNIVSYVSIHTYGQYILLPWGYTETPPPDYDNLMDLARAAEEAMGLPFKKGSSFTTIYPAGGVSTDFARDTAGIARSFTWELMPNKRDVKGHLGFAPNETLVPVYTPIVWRGMRAFVQTVADQTGPTVDKEVAAEDEHGFISVDTGNTGTSVSKQTTDTGLLTFRWYSILLEILKNKSHI